MHSTCTYIYVQQPYINGICLFVQNGGDYEFIVEPLASLPVQQEFWDFLMSSSKQSWNLLVYEQDWLDVEVQRLNSLQVSSK